MSARKRIVADEIKEARKSIYLARLNDFPTSPRKMRLLANLIRNRQVEDALNVLRFHKQHAAKPLAKLLISAINNYEQKTGLPAEDSNLFVKEIFVNGGSILKRFRPAPRGSAYRIRKRSNHVTLILDVVAETEQEPQEQQEKQQPTQ